MQYGTVKEQVFPFRIQAADAITGRGTVIVGIVTAGIVRVGYPLDIHHAGSRRAVSCRGVEFADDLRRSRELPPQTGPSSQASSHLTSRRATSSPLRA